MKLVSVLVFLLVSSSVYSAIELSPQELELIREIKDKKETLDKTEVDSRKIRALIYTASKKLEKLDDQDRELKEEILLAKKRVSDSLSSLKVKKEVIDEERKKIHKRFRLLAAWYRSGVGDLLFSSQSIRDLDKRMYYLRKIILNDSGRLLSFSSDMSDFDSRKFKLRQEIKQMALMRKKLKRNSKVLDKLKNTHKKNLAKVYNSKSKALGQIESLRNKGLAILSSQLLEKSFLEKKGKLKTPVEGELVQNYGLQKFERSRVSLFSNGIKIRASEESAVKAISEGTLVFKGELRNYGKTIVVDHGSHYYSVYGNLERIDAELGASISQDQKLGRLGTDLGGSILYFELRKFSESINPMDWFQDNNIRIAKNQLDSSAI